ncbi:MAG: hypothetical protein ACTSPB_18380 [Candidatus Thorarchaeota archaeon]
MSNEDSTILKILTFEDGSGNGDLDTQLDETATLLFERKQRFNSLEEVVASLQAGIYSNDD